MQKNSKRRKKDLLRISACNSTLLILEFYEIESAKNKSGSHQHFNFDLGFFISANRHKKS